jgi:hypothetical protein
VVVVGVSTSVFAFEVVVGALVDQADQPKKVQSCGRDSAIS